MKKLALYSTVLSVGLLSSSAFAVESVKVSQTTTQSSQNFESFDDSEYIIEEEIEETYVIEELGEAEKEEETKIEKTASQSEKQKAVTINLKDVGIRFATNKTSLDNIAFQRVQNIGAILAKHPELWDRLCIEGHTDSRASEAYNMSLSKGRVTTVQSILMAQGIPSVKLCTKAFGEGLPVDPRNTPYAWEKNRRVELKLYGIDSNSPLATLLAQLFIGNPSTIPSSLIAKRTTIVSNASARTSLPVLVREGDTYTINLYRAGVHFEFDKDRLRPGSKKKVQEIGQLLRRHNSNWKALTLAGHTDSRGSQKYNMNLATRRTKTVGKVLHGEGISFKKVSARAYGENKPLDARQGENAWAKNRRVELKLTGVPERSALARKLESYFKRTN